MPVVRMARPGGMDRGDLDSGLEADGQLVETSRHRPMLLEPANSALDRVTRLVILPVEGRRAATIAAAALAVADLVGRLGDRAPAPASAQVGTVGARGVCLVSPHSQGFASGAPTAGLGHSDGFEDRLELRAVAPLASRDQQRQRLLSLFACQVDLRGEPAPGPAQPVVVRLLAEPAGRFLLPGAVAAGTGRVLVGPATTSAAGTTHPAAATCGTVRKRSARVRTHTADPAMGHRSAWLHRPLLRHPH